MLNFLWGLNVDLSLVILPGMEHIVTNLTASLYFCESSFLVTVVTHFYNTFGLTVAYRISSFSDL